MKRHTFKITLALGLLLGLAFIAQSCGSGDDNTETAGGNEDIIGLICVGENVHFDLSNCRPNMELSLIPGESRRFVIGFEPPPNMQDAPFDVGLGSSNGAAKSAAPSGLTLHFQENTLTRRVTTEMTITTTLSTPVGYYTLPIQMTGREGTNASVDVIVGVTSPFKFGKTEFPEWGDGDLVVAPDRASALVADCMDITTRLEGAPLPRLVRVDLGTLRISKTIIGERFQEIGAENQIGLDSCPTAIAMEGNGETVLVALSGSLFKSHLSVDPSPWFVPSLGGHLARVNLNTGAVTILATGLMSPTGIAIEGSGQTVLITENNIRGGEAGRLLRVDLATGTLTTIASNLNASDLIIDPGGGSVIVNKGETISRISLATGSTKIIAGPSMPGTSVGPIKIAMEPGGKSILTSGLRRVNIDTGVATDVLASGFGGSQIAFVPGGYFLVLFQGTLERIVLSPELRTIGSFGGLGGAVALGEDGDTAYWFRRTLGFSPTSEILRIQLSTEAMTSIPLGSDESFDKLVIEPGGLTALGLDDASGKLKRVGLASGGITTITSGLNCPTDMAIEASGNTALIVEDGENRLIRVNLADGSFNTIATELVPGIIGGFGCGSFGSIAIESGRTAVVGSAMGPLYRVDLNTGSKTVIYPGPTGSRIAFLPGIISSSPGGARLLVGSWPHNYFLLDLFTGERTRFVLSPWGGADMAVIPGKTEALTITFADSKMNLDRLSLSGNLIFTDPDTYHRYAATLGSSASTINFEGLAPCPGDTISGCPEFPGDALLTLGLTFSNPNGYPFFIARGGSSWSPSQSLSVGRFPYDPLEPKLYHEDDDLTVRFGAPVKTAALEIIDQGLNDPGSRGSRLQTVQFKNTAGGIIDSILFPANYKPYRAFVGMIPRIGLVGQIHVEDGADDRDDINFDDVVFYP